METKWLVRAASLAAVVGSLTWQVNAQAQATSPKKEAEDDGPFAPKGKTGKLREEEQAANAPKPEPEAPPPKEKPYGAGVDIVLHCCSAYRAMNLAALKVFQAIRRDGTQKNVVADMQTRDDLYKYLDYHSYERKLDDLFAAEKKK